MFDHFVPHLQTWKPPFCINKDKFSFKPRVQQINELEVRMYVCMYVRMYRTLSKNSSHLMQQKIRLSIRIE